MIIQVRAFSRLHFGLMEISPGQPYCYGGVGMMIDSSSMVIQGVVRNLDDTRTVSSASIPCEGEEYWSDRVRRVVEIWQQRHTHSPVPIASLRLVETPQAHIGLGSGTQWACSIAGMLQLASRHEELASDAQPTWEELFTSADQLATQAGRGLRSHIGCEGFRRGGLIVDWGQHPHVSDQRFQERTQVLAFPEAWRMVTICDRSYEGESGGVEASMFERCSARVNPFRNDMVHMIRHQMIPALMATDWFAASDAIGRYGEWAGRVFEPMQGGVYRSSSIAECIRFLKDQGILGVGQSSWGPTVFALARDQDQAEWIIRQWKSYASKETMVQIAGVAPPATYECDSSS